MSQITKFIIDPSFKARIQKLGFDIDDPNRRYPTRNDFPNKVLGLQQRSRGGLAAQLLSGRQPQNAPIRTRALAWLAIGLGYAVWPENAVALGHQDHLEYVPEPLIDPKPDVRFEFADQLLAFDLSNPIWALAIGAGLLLTQALAVFQRRALLNATSAIVPPVQPDLFPETIEPAPIPMSDHIWHVDAATWQGQVREENQDAVTTITFEDGSHVLIVCDGAGGVGGGREASQSAIAALEKALRATKQPGVPLTTDDLETAISAARKANAEEEQPGVTTALLVSLHDNRMDYATVGDGAITTIWPDGMIGPVQVPHNILEQPSNIISAFVGGECDVPARTGSQRLEPGCMVLVMSDGASDLLHCEDIARNRDKLTDITGLADTILTQLESARDPDSGAWLHSDNMTLAMAKLHKHDNQIEACAVGSSETSNSEDQS